jgi:hypothetical protein
MERWCVVFILHGWLSVELFPCSSISSIVRLWWVLILNWLDLQILCRLPRLPYHESSCAWTVTDKCLLRCPSRGQGGAAGGNYPPTVTLLDSPASALEVGEESSTPSVVSEWDPLLLDKDAESSSELTE